MDFLDRITPEQRIAISAAGLLAVFVLLFAFLSGTGRSFDAANATLKVGDETLSADALYQNEASAAGGLLASLEQGDQVTATPAPTATPVSVSGLTIPTTTAKSTPTSIPTVAVAPTAVPKSTTSPVATAAPVATTAPVQAQAQTQSAALTAGDQAPTATPVPPTPTPELVATPTAEPTATPAVSNDGHEDDGAPWTEVEFASGTYWVSALDGLTVRDEPGGDQIHALHPEEKVVASGKGAMTTRGWAHISSPVDGWVASAYLSGTDPDGAPAPTSTPISVSLQETPEPTAVPTQPSPPAETPTPAPTEAATPTPEPTSSAPTPTPGAGPTGTLADQMAALRQCEAGGNYSINTGNGYYGAYQFAAQTWVNLANKYYPHLADLLPHQASPADQDAMALALYNEQGWSPWPGCTRQLGLS